MRDARRKSPSRGSYERCCARCAATSPWRRRDLTPSAPAGIPSTPASADKSTVPRPAAARWTAAKTTSRHLINTFPSRRFSISARQYFSSWFFPASCWRHRLLQSLLPAAGSARGAALCGYGQYAVGSAGHLLDGGSGCKLAHVTGYHDHEIGVSGVARLRERLSRHRQR